MYKNSTNKHKKYVDWRLPENRQKCFMKWFDWRLSGLTMDHFTWNNAYMNTEHSPTRLPMTREQRLWFSFLFGMTYQSSLAWIFYWHFPDFSKIDMEKLDRWNRETMPRQRFATDTRYNKGHIVKMVKSLQEWVSNNGGTLEKAFDSFVIIGDQEKSFHAIYNEISLKFHKFGRMTAWLFCQCLYESAKLPIKPDTMFTSDPSNVSVWNGMMYYHGVENKTVGKPPKFAGHKPTDKDKEQALLWEQSLMEDAQKQITSKEYLSFFTLETHLCQFKKLNVGHDYPGQNAGDAVTRYLVFKKNWPEVDFTAFEKAEETVMKSCLWKRESKEMMTLFQKTGQLIHIEDPELPDMYLELELDRDILHIDVYDEKTEDRIHNSISIYTRPSLFE